MRREHLLSAITLTLIAATAVAVKSWSQLQRLGNPGVKVVNSPFPGLEPQTSGTNRSFNAGNQSVALPQQVLDYTSEILPLQRLIYDWLPEDTTYGQRIYKAPDGLEIQNLVVLMGADRTSIHQPQYCLVGSGWTIRATEKVVIPVAKPVPYDLPATKLLVSRRYQNAEGKTAELSGVFVYWFVADGHLTNDHKERMWLMAKDLITRRTLQRWAYIISFAPCRPGAEAEVFNRIKSFVAASAPEYQLVPAVTTFP